MDDISSYKTSIRQFGKENGLQAKYYSPLLTKGSIVVSTGVHQHSEIYNIFAERLVQENYAVLLQDHRGFGRSKSQNNMDRSQINYIGEELNALDDLKDAIILLNNLSKTRVFVFGHSLGGLIATLLATTEDKICNLVIGQILSNPSVANPWEGSKELIEEYKKMDKNKIVMNLNEDDEDRFINSMSSNKDFIQLCKNQDPDLIEKNRPFKANQIVNTNNVIEYLRKRFHNFKSSALLLRGGDDIFEQGGCSDLIKGASNEAYIRYISYPKQKHDIIFEPGLIMSKGDNKVVDEIINQMDNLLYN